MFRNAVRPNALIALGKKIIGFHFATGAAHSAHACDQNCFAIDRFAANEGPQRNENARRITTGTGDEFRFANLVPVNLRQTINRLAQQIGRRMIVTVKFLVNRGIFYSKIRAQIDYPRAGG